MAHISYEDHQNSDAQAERIPGSWLGKGSHTLFREPAESQDTSLWTPNRCRRGPSHGSFVVFAATGVLVLRFALNMTVVCKLIPYIVYHKVEHCAHSSSSLRMLSLCSAMLHACHAKGCCCAARGLSSKAILHIEGQLCEAF